MKNWFIILLSILFINKGVFSQENFKYISPKDGAKLISLNTSLIFNAKNEINLTDLSSQLIKVNGTKSGVHKVKVKLSDDKKTLIIIPVKKFLPDETVIVNLNQKIKTTTGEEITPNVFQFKTTPLKQPIKLNPFSTVADGFNLKEDLNANSYSPLMKSSGSKIDTLPSDFPKITIDSLNNPAEGKVFLANFPFGVNDSIGHFLIIENNDGTSDTLQKN